MNRITKRIISVVAVLALSVALAVPVFADNAITPTTSTQTIYMTSNAAGTSSYAHVNLASGTKSFTIKRANTKVSPGKTGARMVSFSKNLSNYETESAYLMSGSKQWQESTYKGVNCSYSAEIEVSAPGTAKVSYKIGNKSYSTSIKVLAYQNPVKSISVTGVNGGKDFAALTKNSAYISKPLALKKTTNNAKVTVAPASGWKLTSIYLYDQETSTSHSISNYNKGLGKTTLNYGTLNPKHHYNLTVTFISASTGSSLGLNYAIN